jgi:transposase-like protein
MHPHKARICPSPLPALCPARLPARRPSVTSAKYPKAVATLEKDADVLLTFFDFPAEHWKHLRTSNVIESPFATVRLRQRVTKGAGSRTKGLLMAYKLLDMAQARWRRLDGAHLLPLVRAGVVFVDGVQQANKRGKPRARAA